MQKSMFLAITFLEESGGPRGELTAIFFTKICPRPF